MKVKYDMEQDILYFSFSDEAICESDEEKDEAQRIAMSKLKAGLRPALHCKARQEPCF